MKKAKRPPTYGELVAKKFAGRTTSPKTVSEYLGVDRAYACRVLQRLVTIGKATKLPGTGSYSINKA